MSISSTLDRLHSEAKGNRWLQYFAIFNRIVLAVGFLPAGMVKIGGERFASGLSVNHPMGHYLSALHETGYYYTFIGYWQVAAAILLLIPRTALLGALIYFPIILNIFILSYALRFDGSTLTSPLMVLSNLYLLCWYYDKLKFILPLNHPTTLSDTTKQKAVSNKFPSMFFACSAATVIILAFVIFTAYKIRPRNTFSECQDQCKGSKKSKACYTFCDCIHKEGQPLDSCLDIYNKTPEDAVKTQ